MLIPHWLSVTSGLTEVNLSSASAPLLGHTEWVCFVSSAESSSSELRCLERKRYEGKALWGNVFLEAFGRCLSFSAFPTIKTVQLPPCAVAANSSLLQQQHGESRREEENNRRNGASAAGFKPPLTTDKQHRPRGSEMRLKTPRNDTPCLSLCGKTENNAYLYVKCEFSCNMGFCFSTLGSPRLPWNSCCSVIGG